MLRPLPLLLLLAAGPLACGDPPAPLPTAAALAEVPDAPPALIQDLYAAPVAPEAAAHQQRVRLLIWLRRMNLDRGQLDRLSALRRLAVDQMARLAQAEAAAAPGPEEEAAWQALWDQLARGAQPEDPAFVAAAAQVAVARAGGERERRLLTLRLEGVRLILEAEHSFLETLTPAQEARVLEASFALRRRLDAWGTPGDASALLGPTWQPGEVGTLLRGTTQGLGDPLDIGALWSDAPDASPARAQALPEARREALIFLILLEPGLDEALAAAAALPAQNMQIP